MKQYALYDNDENLLYTTTKQTNTIKSILKRAKHTPSKIIRDKFGVLCFVVYQTKKSQLYIFNEE